MSSTYIIEPHENEKDSKKDDNFIIVINDDGTMAVDQETLQNLLINKSNANVSVVRVGQTENDGNLTFTVDPSNFEHSDSPITAPSNIDTNLDDPFMAMDPEQLEKLETALQSEEAKQILGENVAAMLDMLTVEEHQNSIRYAVELDHCYTSRSSPLDPEPLDPLPIVNSPENDNTGMINLTMHHQSQSTVFTAIENSTQMTASPVKSIIKTKQPVGRPRKTPISNSQIPNAPKSSNSNVLRNLTTLQLENRKSTTVNQEEENKTNDLSSSTESSDSETSDNDSDFGPRGPRRSGVRARGGRRGLTTRGGSMSATRRRGASKRMDIDQTRKHDSEMAAVVNTMKHSEKSAADDYLSESQLKKQIKINPNQKKEEGSLTHQSSDELLVVPENNLQTTNQAKANLINANMIKGDMILTKPGQLKNQKVYFIKKKVIDKPEDMKSTFTIASKDLNKSANQIQTKLITSQHGKLMAVTPKSIVNNSPQVIQSDADINTIVLPSTQSPAYTQLVQKQLIKSSPVTSSIKIKPTIEVKKDKKKLEGSYEPCPKLEEPLKTISDVKPSDGVKKQIKKDLRKSLGTSVSSLEPALFSTPDIIRRVGSNNESKGHDSNVSFSSGTSISNASGSTLTSSTVVSSDVPFKSNIETLNPEVSAETNNLLSQSLINSDVSTIMFDSDSLEEKSISKLPVTDDLSLDPASQTVINEEIRKSDDSVQNIVSDQNGMEETEHLLATLEMEASKHEEELLAEALLLQEQLDVDLTDTATLDESTNVVPDSLLGTTSFNTEKLSAITTQSFLDETVERVTNIDNLADSHEAEQLKKKNIKEPPSQIFRGGRIITLPPIEAPATRSKKLQVKFESSSKPDDEKKSDKVKKQITQANQIEDMESEIEDDDEEENSDSEDDPNRLWCICKQPHNNRFMICCDVCEDWFHGKCVNVTKTTGKQMEEKGLEWVCPNCTKKKLVQPASTITKSLTIKSPKTESHTQISNTETSLTQSSDGQVEVALNVKQNALSNLAVTQCVVCKKEARSSSIYCSDACILTHAEETSVKDKQVVQSVSSKLKLSLSDTSKSNSEARVIVFEKKTGTVLTGVDAPMASNLKAWLKEHPTFEVARSSNLNILQIGDKMVSAIQTSSPGKMVKPNQQQSKTVQPKMVFTKVVGSKQTVLTSNNKKVTVISNLQNANIISKSGQIKQILVSSNKSQPILKQTTLKNVVNQNKTLPIVIKQTPVKKQEPKCSTPPAKTPQKSLNLKKSEPEPTIRLNVRKTLTELLSTRIKETDDLRLSKEEIENLALKIELEMYKYFRDTGAKYKAKYRSLLFNIKDSKNLTLFRKIADKSLTPDAVVKLSPEEMASQELAEWREKETQHQLEMIKKNELDLMAQAKSIVVKTHKGEQIIENDGGIEAVDPKTPVQDIVTVLNNVDNTSLDTLDEKEDTLSSSFEDVKKIKRNDDKQTKSKDREKEKDGHRSRKNKEHDKDSKKETSSSKRKHRSKDRNRDRRRSKDEKRDKERSRERDRDKDKDKDKNKNKSKDKDRSRKSSKSRSSSHSKSSHKEKQYKDKEKKRNELVDDSKRDESKKKETSPVQTGKLTEDRLWRHVEEETTANTLDGNDSDVSDREPSSTVNLESVDMNDELEKEKDTIIESKSIVIAKDSTKNVSQTVWRGFINMIDVAKFFITAQEVSGQAKELMEDLPDTFEVVGRISHETVWDYISKMKKTGSKEIVIIRFTAANDEEKIPYITLYSYLNSRSRLGVVGNVSKNIKDFYIMPFSSQSQLPPVLFPLNGVGLEEQRPHLLLGIIVQNKRKRLSHNTLSIPLLPKVPKKDSDRSYTPPPVNIATDKLVNSTDVIGEKSTTNQLTVNSFNKTHVGVSRKIIDSATISKIVPELSDKIDLTSSEKPLLEKDDDDEPYSPGDIDDDIDDNLLSPSKNSNELQRKMDEINRQIEEQKQQIQSISSSFLGESVPTLPGLGLDPSDNDLNEAYSPTDVRSFTPPPQGISKFTQPILDKVSNITIPPNLQEILANVKRQECSKFDPYLPSKPSASFLTSINSLNYQKEKTYTPTAVTKESKSTLRSLSDFDLIKKAEEELAAVTPAPIMPVPNMQTLNSVQPFEIANSEFSTSSIDSSESTYPPKLTESVQMSRISEQPKPPGLEDEELPTFPSVTPPTSDAYTLTLQKGVSQSGIMSMKRKVNDDDSPLSHIKTPRVKSRWSQETSD
ncbi:GSCOCG00012187001-RA-CDS [Cotesia congregata]|nr:GSCOCG00012187001-RA-CDS [Cotesia congregata]